MDVALLVLLMPQAAALSFVPPVRAPHTALRLRGGTMALLAAAPTVAAAKPALTNCVGAAAGVFGNIRTPAALLTGAALGAVSRELTEPTSAPCK